MDQLFANHYGTHVKMLRLDHGGEYINMTLNKYCSENGINIKLTVPHTPEQNGVTERANQKILDKGHTIIKDSNAPSFLWADAFTTMVYTLNQTMSMSSADVTPYEAFFQKKPTISHMCIWYSCQDWLQ